MARQSSRLCLEIDMEDDRYVIVCNGKIIAWFANYVDRDECQMFLAERHDDCVFEGLKISENTLLKAISE